MHIVNSIYQVLLYIAQALRRVCCFWERRASNGAAEEGEQLLASDVVSAATEDSLTSTYTDYARSKQAMSLFLMHGISYYGLAVLGFSYLVDKHPVIDSLYMATVTFTTIGYGDVHPTDTAGRLYLIFLATYGIVILGIFLGVLVSL